MGRRPNTIAATTFVSLTEADLVRMTEEQLIEFADRILGIVIPLGTKKSIIVTRIVNSSVAVKDGR